MALLCPLPQSVKKRLKTLGHREPKNAPLPSHQKGCRACPKLFYGFDTPPLGDRIEISTHRLYALGLLVAYAMVNSLTIDREF